MAKTNLDNLQNHHKQLNLCTTRLPYRQGKKLTAVKVYTVSQESQHLFVYGVPKIGLRSDLKSLCSRYGIVLSIHVMSETMETEQFAECFHVQYDRIQSARVAKRVLDNRSFFGSILHVGYAPELENVHETRAKLTQRKYSVLKRICNDYSEEEEKKKPKKRTFSEVSEDPILSNNMRESKSVNQVKKRVCLNNSRNNTNNGEVYGPHLPKDAKNPLLPTCVVKNNLKVSRFENNSVIKRIVFRNSSSYS